MLSSRYAIPVIILLTLALIPTVIHNYLGVTINDGKSVKKIPLTLQNFSSTPTNRNPKWGKHVLDSDDWFERDYQSDSYHKVRLFMARSYDHKRLYHHPESGLSYGHSLTSKGIVKLPDHPEIPIHLLRNDDKSMLAAYTLLYDNEYIKDPILHQLGDSLRLLISARKPMTLFYVSQSGLDPSTRFEQSAAASLLLLAIDSFQSRTKASEPRP